MLNMNSVVIFVLFFANLVAAFRQHRLGAKILHINRTPIVVKELPAPSIALYASPKDAKSEDPTEFWPGEWVCADCGYVYDKEVDGGGLYFEQLPRGFICPQCSAPRKRYAKKVGDKWGVTRDGGDVPIYAFTLLGLVATVWFALVYVPTL